jgi:hypothetical protein
MKYVVAAAKTYPPSLGSSPGLGGDIKYISFLLFSLLSSPHPASTHVVPTESDSECEGLWI